MKKIFTLLALGLFAMSASAYDWSFCGNAAPTGWTDDGGKKQTNAFTKDNNGTLTWIGKLTTGGEGFKITRNDSGFSGWGSYHPSTAGLDIAAAGSDVMVSGGDDTKWTVPSDGIYKMTIDESTNTLTCAVYTPTISENAEGWYELSTAAQLYEFSELVSHNAISANAKAKLTADIDYTAYPYGSIGRSEFAAYAGTFDGQNHKITINLKDIFGRTGLFAYIYGANIKNLEVGGTVTMDNHNCAGGIGGRSDHDGTVIENILCKTNINYNYSNSDATCGGLFANMEGLVTVKNCAFEGSINTGTASGNGGLVGWAGGGSNMNIVDCLVMPTTYTQTGNSADFARNNPTVTNSYKVATTDARLASGELCYLLNEKVSGNEGWYQTLGTDAVPTPLAVSSKLYANGTFYCDGVTSKGGDVVLSNTNASVIDPHTFGEDGVCTWCHAVGEEPTATEGVYQIKNAGNLLWFEQYVNAGNTSANALVSADLDMTGAKYAPIGDGSNKFVGSFDGGNHSIKVAINNPSTNYQGLVGCVADGVTVKNVTVKGSIVGNSYVAGIIGGANGGTDGKKVNILNCGNEAAITASSANAAGIIGVNINGSSHFNIKDCYTAGTINSGKEAGAITGWSGGSNSSMENVYSISVVKNGENNCTDFFRGTGATVKNCYALEGTATTNATGTVNAAAVASGELCYMMGSAFYQTIGTDNNPVLTSTSAAVNYVGADGYATMVAAADCEVNGDAKAYIGTKNEETGKLTLTEVADIPANTGVVLKGTYYNTLATTATSNVEKNDLKAATTDLTASGIQYVLAKNDGVIGFYKATTGTTIAAGKAYLESSSEVKAFTFGDNATAISSMNADATANSAIYNLAGQRISNAQKGIFIQNGKKYLK